MTRNYDKIPQIIRDKGLFCLWRWEKQGERRTKVPYNAISGYRAKSNNPSDFVPFDLAVQLSAFNTGDIGIGIFNGICAIDLDDCIDVFGKIKPHAQEIIDLMHSYTEFSPSGNGIHILFTAEGFDYDTREYYIMNHDEGIEVYVAGATSKYVTVTGNEIGMHYEVGDRSKELSILLEKYMKRKKSEGKSYAVNAINTVNSFFKEEDLIKIASESRNGAAFVRLWTGDWEGDYRSHSEADMALCSHLAFWTGKDAHSMDVFFRMSGLMRDKWDSKRSGSTYGAITIQHAIDNCDAFYQKGVTNRDLIGEKSCQEIMSQNSVANHDGISESENNSVSSTQAVSSDFQELKPLKPQQNDLPSFPVNCLPTVLRDYVSAVAEHSQTSPDMAAVIGLGVLAVCLQGKYQVEGMPGYFEPLSLYTVVIASPGERKSSVMKDMTKYLYEYEREFNKNRAEELKENKNHRDSLSRKISGLQKKLETKNSPELERELQQLEAELDAIPELKPSRFFADDCSSEALTSLIANNDGIFSVISTEGGIFDIMAGRYSSKGNIDVWLKGHCGDAIRVDRMGREPEYIPHPALSAILSIQPSVLDEIMSNTTMTGRGLIARFLYSSPTSRIGTRKYRTQSIAPEVDMNYKNMIYQLMAIPVGDDVETIKLSAEAVEVIADYFEEHERYLIGEGQGISDWASKYIGSVLRIAGLLHLARIEQGNTEISADVIRDAIEIGKYFLAHSMYAYSMMGTDLTIQKARFVWGKIEKNKTEEMKRSELFQKCRGKFFKKAEEFFPTLDLLAEHGYLRLEEPIRSSAGRPPDIKIIVNTKAFGIVEI